MARRIPGQNPEPILNAARRWIDRGLIDDRSVMSDERLWTNESLAEVRRAFVDNPNDQEGIFLRKLPRQVDSSKVD